LLKLQFTVISLCCSVFASFWMDVMINNNLYLILSAKFVANKNERSH
jgi:hypothetical protein